MGVTSDISRRYNHTANSLFLWPLQDFRLFLSDPLALGTKAVLQTYQLGVGITAEPFDLLWFSVIIAVISWLLYENYT